MILVFNTLSFFATDREHFFNFLGTPIDYGGGRNRTLSFLNSSLQQLSNALSYVQHFVCSFIFFRDNNKLMRS